MNFLILQALVMLYSVVSVMSKISSGVAVDKGLFSLRFFCCIMIMFGILGIYAIFWQMVIKNVDISVAYLNKSTGVFWSLLWSFLIFKENVSIFQIIGLVIIIIGVRVIYRYGD